MWVLDLSWAIQPQIMAISLNVEGEHDENSLAAFLVYTRLSNRPFEKC